MMQVIVKRTVGPASRPMSLDEALVPLSFAGFYAHSTDGFVPTFGDATPTDIAAAVGRLLALLVDQRVITLAAAQKVSGNDGEIIVIEESPR